MLGGFLTILFIIYLLPVIVPQFRPVDCGANSIFSLYGLFLTWLLIGPYIANLLIDFCPLPPCAFIP